MQQQPLTKKAKSAILTYVDLNGKKYGYMQHYMVKLTLKADRMPRAKLYSSLEAVGLIWDSKRGFWRRKKNAVKGTKHDG